MVLGCELKMSHDAETILMDLLEHFLQYAYNFFSFIFPPTAALLITRQSMLCMDVLTL